jgi:hypothetical protein
MPPKNPYPEFTYSMPPATTGPGPSIDPPVALTPFTPWCISMAVSTSQKIRPSAVE